MKNKFTEVMTKKTDEQLIKIVTVSKGDYEPLAIEAAENELKTRNIDLQTMKNEEAKFISQSEEADDFEDSKANRTLRFVHFLVDTIAVFLLAFVFSLIIQIFWNPMDDLEESLAGYVTIIFAVFAYFVPLEYNFQKSLGKFLTGTKVVTTEGETPTLGDILRRTACRFIPFDRVSFLFAKHGFHDSFSKTVVVREVK